ncbi:MAG: anaerobic ribonucleoside-triphosphate reductase activating protein [Muribaculaceae bacterium]|nr:anaerobic ribonucleoside-triphosphate reductase activating protein [Muribaculaceae bacterium]
MEYNILSIIRGTTVDGPGFRTSIYLAGCSHACPGCHNPSSWNPEGGSVMTLEEIMEIVKEEDFDVTLSGGDPLFQASKVKTLIETLKEDNRNVWVFTGYLWEQILSSASLLSAVREADIIVDGPFIEKMKDPDLLFRGSSNQRLIDIKKTLESGQIVLYSRQS